MRPAPTRRHCARRARSSRCCAARPPQTIGRPERDSTHASSRHTPRRARAPMWRRSSRSSPRHLKEKKQPGSARTRSPPPARSQARHARAVGTSVRQRASRAAARRHQLRQRRVRRRSSVGARASLVASLRVVRRRRVGRAVVRGGEQRLRRTRASGRRHGTAAVVEGGGAAGGLGTLGHKLPIVVNAAFTPASAKLLHAVLAGGASADSGLAVAFCELAARAAIEVDETPSPVAARRRPPR